MPPGWEMEEWKIVLSAPQELSAPVGPPNQFCAQCKYIPCGAVAVQVQKKTLLHGISEHFWV